MQSLGAQASGLATDDPGASVAQGWLAALAADGLDAEALAIAMEAGQGLLIQADGDETPDDYARQLDEMRSASSASESSAALYAMPAMQWTGDETQRHATAVLAGLVSQGLVDDAADERLLSHARSALDTRDAVAVSAVLPGSLAERPAWGALLTTPEALGVLWGGWGGACEAWRGVALDSAGEGLLDAAEAAAGDASGTGDAGEPAWRALRASLGEAGWASALGARPGLRRARERAWPALSGEALLAELSPFVQADDAAVRRWAVSGLERYGGVWPAALTDALLASSDAWVVERACQHLIQMRQWVEACRLLQAMQRSREPREAKAARRLRAALGRVKGNRAVDAAVRGFRYSPAWWVTALGRGRAQTKGAA